MQLQQTSQELEHAKAMNDGVQKHSRLKREVTKHRAALAYAKSTIDDLQDALLASVAGPPAASELRLVPASVLASRLA
eukprot:scaffold357_cov66-Phaeocystis_antarctica.AAC.3